MLIFVRYKVMSLLTFSLREPLETELIVIINTRRLASLRLFSRISRRHEDRS